MKTPYRDFSFLPKKVEMNNIPKDYSVIKVECPHCHHHKATARDTRDNFICCKCRKPFEAKK